MSKSWIRKAISALLALATVSGLLAGRVSANGSQQWLINPQTGQVVEAVIEPDKCFTVTVKDDRGNLLGGQASKFKVVVAGEDVTAKYTISEVYNRSWPYPYDPNYRPPHETANYESTGRYTVCKTEGTLPKNTKFQVTLDFTGDPVYKGKTTVYVETDDNGKVTAAPQVKALRATAKAWPITVKTVTSNYEPARYVAYRFVSLKTNAAGKYLLDADGNYQVDRVINMDTEHDSLTNIDGYDGASEFIVRHPDGRYTIGDYPIRPGEMIGVEYVGQFADPEGTKPVSGMKPKKTLITLNPWKLEGADRYDGPGMTSSDAEIPKVDGKYNVVPGGEVNTGFLIGEPKMTLKVDVVRTDTATKRSVPVAGAEVTLYKNGTPTGSASWNANRTATTNSGGTAIFDDVSVSEAVEILGLDKQGPDTSGDKAVAPYGVKLSALPGDLYEYEGVRPVTLKKSSLEAILSGGSSAADVTAKQTTAFSDKGKLTVSLQMQAGSDNVLRAEGGSRFATAVAIAEATFPDGPPARGRWETDGDGTDNSYEDHYRDILLANGYSYPDALAGNPLAALYNGPILLTEKNSLPAVTKAYIEGVKKQDPSLKVRVTLLGGSLAISTSVQQELTAMGVAVERVHGKNRIQTAIAIGNQMQKVQNDANKVKFLHGWGEQATVILANANNFADVLAVSAPAAEYGIPILLTPTAYLDPATAATLKSWNVQKVVLVGGPLALSKNTESAVQNLGIATDRVQGLNRRSTALEVGTYFDYDTKVFVARDDQFADALAGALLAAKEGAPILLVNTRDLAKNEEVVQYIKDIPVTDITILGGPLAVPNAVRHQLAQGILGN